MVDCLETNAKTTEETNETKLNKIGESYKNTINLKHCAFWGGMFEKLNIPEEELEQHIQTQEDMLNTFLNNILLAFQDYQNLYEKLEKIDSQAAKCTIQDLNEEEIKIKQVEYVLTEKRKTFENLQKIYKIAESYKNTIINNCFIPLQNNTSINREMPKQKINNYIQSQQKNLDNMLKKFTDCNLLSEACKDSNLGKNINDLEQDINNLQKNIEEVVQKIQDLENHEVKHDN